jgi:hypothetical protein
MDAFFMCRVIVAVGFLVLLLGQQTLNNDSVINLMKAGFSEEVIISAINRSLGAYDTSVDGLITLKKAGLTNKEISAIVAKAYPQSSAALVVPVAGGASNPRPAPLPASSGNKPRVFLRAQTHSSGWNESRDQTMEMSKDFQEVCPEVQISINPNLLDYTVQLNHSEYSFVRQNQMQIANKDGDLVSRTEGGSIKEGSIKGDVKKACKAIIADWTKK